MRIFGIPIIIDFGLDMEMEVIIEDHEYATHVEYVNEVLTSFPEDEDDTWEYPNNEHAQLEKKWWQR